MFTGFPEGSPLPDAELLITTDDMIISADAGMSTCPAAVCAGLTLAISKIRSMICGKAIHRRHNLTTNATSCTDGKIGQLEKSDLLGRKKLIRTAGFEKIGKDGWT
jgi:hypothetical protein